MGSGKKNRFKKGAYIYIEGDDDINSVFIVEEGRIAFESSNQYVSSFKKTAKPGEVIGFVSSLSNQPRIESAYALTDCILIELTRSEFLQIVGKNSAIALKIINYFANQLRKYDNLMFSTEESEDIIPVDVRFYKLGEFYFKQKKLNYAFYIMKRFGTLYPGSHYRNRADEILEKIRERIKNDISEPVKRGMYLDFPDNRIIFCEDEPGDELYIIKEGKVKIVKYHNKNEIMLSVLNEGDIFGELAIVSDKPRNATAISFGNTKLLSITRESLSGLINQSPELLNKIFASISKRVWFTYIRLESKMHKKPITRLYAFLEDKLLEEGVALKEKKTHVFHFGINELLDMTDLTQETAAGSMDELFGDRNLGFSMGQITIYDTREVSSKARYYRSRDNLFAGEDLSLENKGV